MRKLGRTNRRSLEAVEAAMELLREDALHPRLGSHKLKGDLAGLWACSAGYDLRIVYEIVKQQNSEAILLVSVGTHDEVY